MQLRLYFDDDIASRGLIRALRLSLIDAVASHEVDMYGRTDADHLSYSTAQERVLCSANRGDFIRLHGECLQSGRHHAGIILINQQQHSIGEQLRRLLRIAAERTRAEMVDQLEFLTRWASAEE